MEPTPPPGYAVRRPTMADLGAVAGFLEVVTVAEFGEPDYSEDDLRDEWAETDLAVDAWLVVAPGGRVVGYAGLGHRGHVRVDADGYVHPQHEGRGLGTFLVRATEARAREFVPLAPPNVRVALNNGINGRNPRARRLLAGEGYEAARFFWRMVTDLPDPPPQPVWPAGVTVRTAASGADERAVFSAIDEAFQDHWGHVPSTFEAWARRKKGERHDPTLWFLAVAGEEVAGAAVCRRDGEMGWVDSLGVRRGWRRRGLGQALLRHAFNTFRERGWRRAGLGVDAANETGATRLYEGAGMRVDRHYAIYEKELRPGLAAPSGEDG